MKISNIIFTALAILLVLTVIGCKKELPREKPIIDEKPVIGEPSPEEAVSSVVDDSMIAEESEVEIGSMI
jgi:hypothetical protein